MPDNKSLAAHRTGIEADLKLDYFIAAALMAILSYFLKDTSFVAIGLNSSTISLSAYLVFFIGGVFAFRALALAGEVSLWNHNFLQDGIDARAISKDLDRLDGNSFQDSGTGEEKTRAELVQHRDELWISRKIVTRRLTLKKLPVINPVRLEISF